VLKLKRPAFNICAWNIAETATSKGPMKSHRAPIPTTGHYEWRALRMDGKGAGLGCGGRAAGHSRAEPGTPPPRWRGFWLDPDIECDQDLVDAAVQAALPVAAGLEAYAVNSIPHRAEGPQLIKPASR